MKFFEKKRGTKTIQKDSADSESSQNLDKLSKEQHSLEGIYEDNIVVQLAERCKSGDVSAMRQMAAFFRNRCTSSLLELLDCYESDSIEDNEIAIKDYLKRNYHESETARSYMMWLVRAALYGDAEISIKLEKWPFYKQFAYIPYDMMTGKGNPFIKIWNSSFLHEIGFIDVPVEYKDCSLRYNVAKKYFILCYVSFYDPPDEYGFGAEWEYSYVYFDEFFCRLPEMPNKSND